MGGIGRPMRGRDLIKWPERQWEASKNVHERGQTERQKDRKTDIETLWKNRPKGRFFEILCGTMYTPGKGLLAPSKSSAD